MDDKKILEDVLKYLAPHMKFSAFFIFNKKEEEIDFLKKRITEGLESGYVNFSDDKKYDIDLKKLEQEKGKEWVKLLKRQLIILRGTLEKVRM